MEEGEEGDYRLLSNALLRGQNQRRYLWEPQGVEEKKRELATENRFVPRPVTTNVICI